MTVRKAMMPALMFALGLGAALAGCAYESDGQDARGLTAEQQETVDNLLELGIAAEAIELAHGAVHLGGDAEVSLRASREMLGLGRGSTQERWVSNNRVGTAVTRICVNGLAYTGAFGTALNGALSQLNSLALRFTFQRTTGSTSGCSAVITARTATGFARSSGFPAGGLPYSSFTLGTGFANYDVASIRFQILHLIGHTIGLLHADLENTQISCGPGSGGIGGGGDSSAPGGVGAIAIPGLPVATVGGSVMNTCYRAMEPGVLTTSDRTLLSYVY